MRPLLKYTNHFNRKPLHLSGDPSNLSGLLAGNVSVLLTATGLLATETGVEAGASEETVRSHSWAAISFIPVRS